MNLTGLFQGNWCFYVLLLCSVQRSKESSLFHGWRSVSIIGLLTLQYLNSYYLEEIKLKAWLPDSVCTDSVQTSLVLGLPFAQINLSIRDLSCASSHRLQASLFFLPWWIILQHRYMCHDGGYHLYPYFFVLSWQLSRYFLNLLGGDVVCAHVCQQQV